jgi:hypothetical protein
VSDRLRSSIDTLLWLGAGVVALAIAPLLLLADAVTAARAVRAAGGAS